LIARHLIPGGTIEARPDLSDEERASLNADTSVHRIAHVSEAEPEALLGLLRAQLEHVRQWQFQRDTYELCNYINASLDPLYANKAGGAVVYNAIPFIREATAAGGKLIRSVYGPQYGKFYDPSFGPLYRIDHEPAALEEFPRRSIVFAAIHAAAFEQWAARHNFTLEATLQLVHPEGSRWWTLLNEDELFGHLAGSAPAYNPTTAEIETYGDTPATAWRPLEALLDRALERGLWVTAQSSVGPPGRARGQLVQVEVEAR